MEVRVIMVRIFEGILSLNLNFCAFLEEIHVPKNVKVLTFPSSVNYLNNEKFIIEEVNFVIYFKRFFMI